MASQGDMSARMCAPNISNECSCLRHILSEWARDPADHPRCVRYQVLNEVRQIIWVGASESNHDVAIIAVMVGLCLKSRRIVRRNLQSRKTVLSIHLLVNIVA